MAQSAAVVWFDRLPQELMDKISEMLDGEARLALALTSRAMYHRLMVTFWRTVRLEGREATMGANLTLFSRRAYEAHQKRHLIDPFTDFIRNATIQLSEQRIVRGGRWDHSIVPPSRMPLDELAVQILRAVAWMTKVRYLDLWLPNAPLPRPRALRTYLRYDGKSQKWDSVRFLRLRVEDVALEQHILARMVDDLEGLHMDRTIGKLNEANLVRHSRLERLSVHLDEWIMRFASTYNPSYEPRQIPKLNKYFPQLKWLVLGEPLDQLWGRPYATNEWKERFEALMSGVETLPRLERLALVIHPAAINKSIMEEAKNLDGVYTRLISVMGKRCPMVRRVAVMEDHPWYFEGVRRSDGMMDIRELSCTGAEMGVWPCGINDK